MLSSLEPVSHEVAAISFSCVYQYSQLLQVYNLVSIEMLASRMETVSIRAHFSKAVRSAVFQFLKHDNSYARDSIHWSMQLLTSEP
jgi:hypothetical protein